MMAPKHIAILEATEAIQDSVVKGVEFLACNFGPENQAYLGTETQMGPG